VDEPFTRQAVHVVYGGAHLFKAGTCRKLGDLALRALVEHAPDEAAFAADFGLPPPLATLVYPRVLEKLRREPVEDFRIDFEDGFGFRSDSEEDAAADAAASETVAALEQALLPPFFGIRIKPLNSECKQRSLRTLQRFLDGLEDQIPENFVVTLPKITSPEQVSQLARALDPLPMEMMIETPQALTRIPELIAAADGRCVAAHFGPYDYTASLGITASRQHLLHPACDFARSLMQIHFAGSGIRLSDGPTNILPIPPHSVPAAWKLHYDGVSHALDCGIYQGWDLHPAQLPSRFAAVYAFFLQSLDAASERLRNFIAHAAQATRVGGVFDDAATGQALLNYFRRAVDSGAISEEEAAKRTGLTLDQLGSAFFSTIVGLN
jgi:citrate lyase beta subunit